MIDLQEVLSKIRPFVAGWIGGFLYDGGAQMWNDGTQVGLAFRYRANGAVTLGDMLEFSQTVSGRVKICAANSDMPVGPALNSAADGEWVWVGQYGKFNVMFKGGVTPTCGYVGYVSDTAGRADNAASLPSTTQHNREIGHVVETGTAGGLGLVWMQFN